MTMQSQPASISASERAKPASPTVVAAATRSRPSRILGGERRGDRLLDVLDGDQADADGRASSTTSNFSIRRWWRIRRASSWLVPSADRREIVLGHQLADTAGFGFSAKRTSRLVRMPAQLARLLDDRDAADAVGLHQLQRLGQGLVRASW